jgi:hypothetical protein
MKTSYILWILFSCVSITQTQASDSFYSLYEEAKVNAHNLVGARHDAKAAEAGLREAWSHFFPTLSLNSSYTKFDSETRMGGIETGASNGYASNNSVSLDFIFYNRDILLGTKLSKLGHEAKLISLASLEQEFRAKFAKVYMDTLTAYLSYVDINYQYEIVTSLKKKAQEADMDENIIGNLESAEVPLYMGRNGLRTAFLNAKTNLEIITGRAKDGQTIDNLNITGSDYDFTKNQFSKGDELRVRALSSAVYGNGSLNYWGLSTSVPRKNYNIQLASKGVDVSNTISDNSNKPNFTIGASLGRSYNSNDIHGFNDHINDRGTTATVFLSYKFNLMGKKHSSRRTREENHASSARLLDVEQQLTSGITSLTNALTLNYDTYDYLNNSESGELSRIAGADKKMIEIHKLFNDGNADLTLVISKLAMLTQLRALYKQNTANIRAILGTEITLLELTSELDEDYMRLLSNQVFTESFETNF